MLEIILYYGVILIGSIAIGTTLGILTASYAHRRDKKKDK